MTRVPWSDHREKEVNIKIKKVFAYPLLKHCYLKSQCLWHQGFELVNILSDYSKAQLQRAQVKDMLPVV